jgi:hypothetical protein
MSYKDPSKSKAAHDGKVAATEDHSGGGGAYIKSVVFGGLDGIVAVFSVVTGGAGGNLSGRAILIFSLANLIADAFAMGLGDYLSSRAEENLGKKILNFK